MCDGLSSIAIRYDQFPSVGRQRVIQESFLQLGFPLPLDCIDGSHVAITAPDSNEEVYVNRKLFHYIYIQAICDYGFPFIDSVVVWPGSTHDAFIWRQSAVKENIKWHCTNSSWMVIG